MKPWTERLADKLKLDVRAVAEALDLLVEEDAAAARVLFFGVHPRGRAGHFLHGDGLGAMDKDASDPAPLRAGKALANWAERAWQRAGELDSAHQGEWVEVHHYGYGWTFVAFRDQTGDSREGSVSAFAAPGLLDGEAVLRLARVRWSGVFERFRGGGGVLRRRVEGA